MQSPQPLHLCSFPLPLPEQWRPLNQRKPPVDSRSGGRSVDICQTQPAELVLPSFSKALHYYHYKGQKEYVVVGGDNEIQVVLKADEDATEAYVLDYHYEVPEGYAGALSGEINCVVPVSSPGACDRFTIVQKNNGLTFFHAEWKPKAGDELILRGTARITDTVPPKEGLSVALTAVLANSVQPIVAPMRLEVKLFPNEEAAKATQNMKPEPPNAQAPKSQTPKTTDSKAKDPKVKGTTDKVKNPKVGQLAKTGWETGILVSVAILGAATGTVLLRRR